MVGQVGIKFFLLFGLKDAVLHQKIGQWRRGLRKLSPSTLRLNDPGNAFL